MKELFDLKMPPENVMIYDIWLRMVNNQNNFSYWYERVKDCGIKIPRSVYYQLTYDDFIQFINYIYAEDKDMERKRKSFINHIVIKLMNNFRRVSDGRSLFIKNATFSNKFKFSDCHFENFVNSLFTAYEIISKIENINYSGLLVGAEGFNELVFREYIEPVINLGTIYDGMVLRPEFRVFYDFDKHKVLYTINYWDYQYCKDYLNEKDKEVFAKAESKLNNYFDKYVSEVDNLVSEHMTNAWLEGMWSIDIMMNAEGDFYLIDMALAEHSAYWNPDSVDESNE